MSLINSLPNLVLGEIFGFLSTRERITIIGLVCKSWRSIVLSSSAWKSVDLNWQRRVTLSTLEGIVFPGTRQVLLNECVYLNWREVEVILRRCKRLNSLALSFMSYTEGQCRHTINIDQLNISHLQYLDLSNCTLTDSLYELVASTCENLSVFLLQNSKGISRNTFMSQHFKQQKQLKILNIAYVPEALSLPSVLSILGYSNSMVCLDIRGNRLADDELDVILTTFPDRIVEVEDYAHMLY